MFERLNGKSMFPFPTLEEHKGLCGTYRFKHDLDSTDGQRLFTVSIPLAFAVLGGNAGQSPWAVQGYRFKRLTLQHGWCNIRQVSIPLSSAVLGGNVGHGPVLFRDIDSNASDGSDDFVAGSGFHSLTRDISDQTPPQLRRQAIHRPRFPFPTLKEHKGLHAGHINSN